MAREGWHGPNGHRRPLAPQPKFDLAALGGAARPGPHGQAAKLTKQQIGNVIKLVDSMVQEAMAEDEVTQLLPLQVLVLVYIY